jgi:hypothetical protein
MHPSFLTGGFGGFDDDGELDLALGDLETLGTPFSSLVYRQCNLHTSTHADAGAGGGGDWDGDLDLDLDLESLGVTETAAAPALKSKPAKAEPAKPSAQASSVWDNDDFFDDF